ncbi:MAG: TonB-dependent receptor [Bacteroidetes bacterium]|nr:TonB-dependent receptor [Bacteroidota bacterium]
MMANAQNISGVVKEENGKFSNGATVSLLKANDSAIVKYAATKDNGRFKFETITQGKYIIKVTHVGYLPKYGDAFTVGNEDILLPDITLKKMAAELAAVTVTSQKPIVEMKADKMIVNVEGTINAVGNDGLELLRKSPGVMIDKDDNISLAGKNGVQIYIDGKPSPLTGTDLSNYLKTMQSAQIESIEIITNPSAKYEAAGNAGIINIRLKKNKTFGTNGTVNAGYNIGTYAKYNGGFSLNNRNAKTNIFGNYNYSQSLNSNAFVSSRYQGDTLFSQANEIKSKIKGSHNFKTGVDYFINKNSTIGAIINGNLSASSINTAGPMDFIYLPTNTLTKTLYATGDNELKRNNINFNLNYRYAIAGGKELNVDADYGFYNLRTNQYQPNIYYDANGGKLNSNIYHTISPSDIDIASVKVDYEQNYKKGRLGFGGKISNVVTKNDLEKYDVINNAEIYNKDESNIFKYKENINAVYANYNRALKGITLQAGLRVENTNSNGRSTGLKFDNSSNSYVPYDSTIQRSYVDFFPSAAITFNKNPMKQWGITYSRRIDRPAYQDLNPFEFKINDYTFMKGNTQLKPQYTNSYGVSYTYKFKLNTLLNYSHVKDIFTLLPDTIDVSKSFLSKKNLATQDIISLNISYPFQYKWYSFFVNSNSYYSKYKANFGAAGRSVNLDVFAYSFYMQNGFNLGKSWKGELSGFYNSPSIWQGIFKSKAMYSVDAGLQKTILKGKGNVKVSVSDIFKTMKWSGSSNFAGQISTASGHWESRQFKINFNWRFGNTQVKASRQRKLGTEEENKRTQSSGGTGVGVGN